jgi:tetratricopeptide (TPR) repeat protein
MSHSEINQLTKAEQFFDEGKLDKALELLNDSGQLEKLNIEEKSQLQFLKGLILIYQNKSLELIELGELMLQEGRSFKENLLCFDGLFFIAYGLDLEKKFESAINRIEQAEKLLENISNSPKKVIIRRKFRLNVLKTMIDLHMGKINTAERSLEELLTSQEELDVTWELLWAITNMAYIKLIMRAEFDLALEYSKKVMNYTKQIKFNHFWIGYCFLGIGVINMKKCEYELSFKNHIESLKYFKQINNPWFIANIYNNLGALYSLKGEYNTALKYLEEAISIWEPYPLSRDWCLDTLIYVSLENEDQERAQKYFQRLEELYNENTSFEEIYKLNKARILKRSPRIRDRAKVESLLKEIIKRKSFIFEIKISAYINLCDILLEEYRLNNYPGVLDEIKLYLTDLLNLAENSHSFFVFCNVFILKAKLALINFDTKTARRFLTQAQRIVESYGIKRLAMKISYEHDNLLKELHKWEILNKSHASLTERIELARLDDQMITMLKRRSIEVPEISKENPVMILFLTEGGNLLFSKKFKEDFSFEDDILGGFLTTVNYIISEVFSEGLDRAVFGQYTLLMMPLQPFLVCYIFKGASYYAYHKIKNFLDSIQNDNLIWQSLQIFYQKSKSVQLNDIPTLETLITEIFLEKKNQ